MRMVIAATALFAVSVGVAGAQTGSAPALPAGDGQKQVIDACQGCHDLSMVTDQKHNAAEWKMIVDTMVERGAQVKPADHDAIVAYLAKNFGS